MDKSGHERPALSCFLQKITDSEESATFPNVLEILGSFQGSRMTISPKNMY